MIKKQVLKQAVGWGQEKSEIVAIPNWYKDTLDNFIDDSDHNSDIEPPAILREIVVLSGNIPDLRDNPKSLKKDRDFLGNGPQKWQQRGSEGIDNDENIRIPVVRGRKIAIISASAKPGVRKKLMTSIKLALVENRWDISVNKI